jgi:phospholipid/cholesterol/gamma-HCH transport system substrate-binding protein
VKLPSIGGGRVVRILALVVIGVLVIAGVTALVTSGGEKQMTAMFPRTVSVYEGSDVRVLGVKMGTVDTVEPAGTSVKVTMTYDEKVKIPDDVKAAIIAPSVVGDRYVQLTPVYKGGEVLGNNATLGLDRTAVPIELDQIYENISELTYALGPEGANEDGSLTRLIRSTARNFGGQGEQFNQTIRDLSQFTTTLDNRKEDLFSTVRQVEVFVGALEENDRTVRDFNDSLQGAASLLEEERDDLAAALRNLGIAMTAVRGFVNDNEEALSSNIKGLVEVTDVLVKRRSELAESLQVAPGALTNLYHTYNTSNGTLDVRTNFGYNVEKLTTDPLGVVCDLIALSPSACESLAGPLAGGGDGPSLSAPRAPAGQGRLGDLDRRQPAPRAAVEVEPIDTTLGGILGETR